MIRSIVVFTTAFFLLSTPVFAQTGITITGTVTASCTSNCTGRISIQTSGTPNCLNAYAWSSGATSSNLSNVCPGTYTITVYDCQNSTATATFTVPKNSGLSDSILIYSDNTAPCNAESQNVCEQVCPNTVVTYRTEGLDTAGNIPFVWRVTGATRFIRNPDNSITVYWGSPGAGTVSLLGDGPVSSCVNEITKCVTIVETPVAAIQSLPAPEQDTIRVCTGQTVQFQNKSQFSDLAAWQFSDDGTSGTAENIAHTFQTPGIFKVTLIARSLCLCADTTVQIIEVSEGLSPTLDCIGTVCPGETVTYTATGGCPPFNWSTSSNAHIVAGGTAQTDSITIQWNSGPTGTITLTGSTCSGKGCLRPTVIPVPIISDNADITGKETVCPGSSESYRIDHFGGTGYQWKLSGGGIITAGQGTNRVEIAWGTATNPGLTHWLSVEYDNCYLGCKGRDSIPVRVLSRFGISGPVELCEKTPFVNFEARLTANSQFLTCNWKLLAPDGSTVWNSPFSNSAANAVPFEKGAGLYRLLATAAPGQSCETTREWVIQVAPKPPKPAVVEGQRDICPGTPYSYEVKPDDPQYNIIWRIQNNGSFTDNGNPANVTWATSGLRSIAAARVSTDGLGCMSDTFAIPIKALTAPVISGPSIVCENQTGTYSIALQKNVDISWKIIPATAGAFANGQGTESVEIFWSQPGGHALEVTVCGLKSIFPVTVPTPPAPVVQHIAGLCPGKMAPASTATTFSSYIWAQPDGSVVSNLAQPALSSGSYALTVKDGIGCTATTAFNIEAYPAPNLKITTADPTVFCNNSRKVTMTALSEQDGDFQYTWFRDGNPVGGNTVKYTTNQYGNYTAQVTNQYGCTATDGTIHVFESCAGGSGYNPSHGPACNPGDLDFQIVPTTACDSFGFKIAPGPLYVPGNITWAFGESGSTVLGVSTLENPVFKFKNAGKYIVVLYATLANGTTCIVLDSLQVEAVAQMSAVPKCAGSATPFTDESTFLPGSGIVGWQWDFGEPGSGSQNTTTARNAAHTFATGNTYPATLTVTANSGCTAQTRQWIPIPDGTPAFFALPAARCAGNASAFQALTAPDLTRIAWLFGEPATGAANDAEGVSVYHNYTMPGTYTAKVTTTNTKGCTAMYSQNIAIVPNPLVGNITPNNPPSLCEGSSQIFTAPPGGIQWLWSDKTTTTNTFTAAKEGVFRVTITDANGCTYAPPPVKLNVNPAPDVRIKALLKDTSGQIVGTTSQAIQVCFGEDVYLQAVSPTAVAYQWSGGGIGNDIAFTKDRNNLLAVGTHQYYVTVRDAQNCTTVSTPFTVVVNPTPAPFSINSSHFCAGTPVSIQYSGPAVAASDRLIWNNGKEGLTITTGEPGRYFLRIVNAFGCAATSNDWVLMPGPAADMVPAGCHRRCRPDTFCLPDVPNIASWQWFYNGMPVPGANTRDFIAKQNGTYYAQISDVNGCKANTGPLTLELLNGFGDVTAKVWADVNNNGVQDAADTLVSGIDLHLLYNGNTIRTIPTGNAGQAVFISLEAGDYTLQFGTLPPGWKPVSNPVTVSVTGCNDQKNGDLLLAKGCLAGDSTLSIAVCPGDSVVYQNMWLKAGTTRMFTLKTTQGCDSTVVVSVIARAVSTGTLLAKACAGAAFEYQNVVLMPGETRDFILQNSAGCDSVVTVTVQAIPIKTNTLHWSVCPGQTLTYLGIELRPGQVETFPLTGWQGCDSLVTVSVAALPVPADTLLAKVCAGEAFTYQNTLLFPGDVQLFILQTAAGCDSLVTVQVEALPRNKSAFNATVCPGEAFTYLSIELRAGDVQDFNLTSWQGCDSVVTVSVTARPVSKGMYTPTICAHDTVYYHGKPYLAGDTASVILQGYNGCDSVVALRILAFPTASFGLRTEISCPNQPTGTITVADATGGLPPYRFALDGKNFQNNTQFSNLPAGHHTIRMEDANGCHYRRDTLLQARENLLALAPPATLDCDRTAVSLTVWTGGDTTGLGFKWWDGTKGPDAIATDAGVWPVEVYNICETLKREVVVRWADFGSAEDLPFVPNVFRPFDANTAQNAYFRPFFPPTVRVQSYQFEVFDRWGNLLFRTNDPEAGWDGGTRNRRQPSEVLVWHLEARAEFCGRSVEIVRKGDVTIVR